MDYGTATVYRIAILAGAMLGGTLSLLYAPQPGKETRKLLREGTEFVRMITCRPAHEDTNVYDDDEYARKLDSLHIRSVKEGKMHNRLVTMGFVTGAIIGGVLGLLYAPKSGKETRDFLKTKAEYTKEEARILAEHARDVAIEKARQAKAAADAVAREIKAEPKQG